MARFLAGKGKPNTEFHVDDGEGKREVFGYIAQFWMNYPREEGQAEAHQLFLDNLEITPEAWPEPGSTYDGEPEIVKVVLDGKAVITRQVIRVPEVGEDAAVVSYLGYHDVPATETLEDMDFPTDELKEQPELAQSDDMLA